ncbi:MAG: hypothetical protein RR033_03500 [Clostridia bacterium]
MEKIDLNGLYEDYLKKVVKDNPSKYSDVESLEVDIGHLTDLWENTPELKLNSLSPREFVADLAVKHELYDYAEDCLEAGFEVADVVCFELLKQPDVEEFLARLLVSEIKDAQMLGAVLLREKGGEKVINVFLEAIINPNYNDEVKKIAYEFLCESEPTVVDKILALINDIKESEQGILVEIMAEYKGNKAVFFWLVTMLFRAEDVALYAKLLGKYEDETAIDILKSFATDNDINYVEYVEIRNAVERLGGEFDIEKDFTNDELYAYLKGADITDPEADVQ